MVTIEISRVAAMDNTNRESIRIDRLQAAEKQLLWGYLKKELPTEAEHLKACKQSDEPPRIRIETLSWKKKEHFWVFLKKNLPEEAIFLRRHYRWSLKPVMDVMVDHLSDQQWQQLYEFLQAEDIGAANSMHTMKYDKEFNDFATEVENVFGKAERTVLIDFYLLPRVIAFIPASAFCEQTSICAS